ncbi:MAG: MATE family efflux transporter [candidate division KSB1 bacterium]|nr:MATE family efflux transporter [candidate division KSB1 bacterium]
MKKSAFRSFIKTSLPAAADLSSQTIMWTIEAILIGKLSAAALAGHGMAIQVVVVFFAVLLTFVVGAGLIINHYLGASNRHEANHIFGQAMIMGIILACCICLIWRFGAVHLFKLIKEGSSSSAQAAGESYLRTLSYFPFIMINFVATGIIRATGDTRHSMTVNLLINSLNVCLSPCLIFGLFFFPKLGVPGAALAAGISHTLGFILSFYYLRSGNVSVRLCFSELSRPRLKSFKYLFLKGFPTTMEQAGWAFGQLVVMGYVGSMGVVYLSTHTIFMRVQNILSMFYMGFSLAAMSYMGKHLGAKDRELAENAAHAAHRAMVLFIMVIVAVMLLSSRFVIKIFTTNPETVALGSGVIFVFALAQIPKAMNNVISGNLRGADELHWLMYTVMAFVLVFEIGFNYIAAFVFGWGLWGVWSIQTVDESIRVGLNYLRFLKGSWRKSASE